MAKFLPKGEKITLLDCATGTADQLIALMDNCPRIEKAVGIDLAEEMVAIGKKKSPQSPTLIKSPFRSQAPSNFHSKMQPSIASPSPSASAM